METRGREENPRRGIDGKSNVETIVDQEDLRKYLEVTRQFTEKICGSIVVDNSVVSVSTLKDHSLVPSGD